jgi:hypothetical protein
MTDPESVRESEILERIRAIDEPAPERLHARVAALVADGAPATGQTSRRSLRHRIAGSPLRLRLTLAGSSLAAAAVLAVALALALGGSSGTGTMSLSQEAALTLRSATLAAPAQSARTASELTADVEGISFPSWSDSGWHTSGARRDSLDGRTVQTVFYTGPRGQRIGYAIAAGTPAPPGPGDGRMSWRKGTPYALYSENGVRVVTWLRDGRRCVLSGRGVAAATLLRLASWDDGPTES